MVLVVWKVGCLERLTPLGPVQVGMELPLSDAGKAHVEVMEPAAGGSAGNIVLMT